MTWFRKKPQNNPVYKYINRLHWSKIQKNSDLAKIGDWQGIIDNGLRFEGRIKHTGDAILLFDAFFAMSKPESWTHKRRIAEFLSTDGLQGFDPIDHRYLLSVASASLREHCLDASKNDKIHKIVGPYPNPKGVNPLLLQLFKVDFPSETKPTAVPVHAPLKLRGPRPISISETQIIGVSWSVKKNKNGAILEYARSGHGGGIAKVQMSAEEFELLKQGKGIHAAFFTKEEREKFFGTTGKSV